MSLFPHPQHTHTSMASCSFFRMSLTDHLLMAYTDTYWYILIDLIYLSIYIYIMHDLMVGFVRSAGHDEIIHFLLCTCLYCGSSTAAVGVRTSHALGTFTVTHTSIKAVNVMAETILTIQTRLLATNRPYNMSSEIMWGTMAVSPHDKTASQDYVYNCSLYCTSFVALLDILYLCHCRICVML